MWKMYWYQHHEKVTPYSYRARVRARVSNCWGEGGGGGVTIWTRVKPILTLRACPLGIGLIIVRVRIRAIGFMGRGMGI